VNERNRNRLEYALCLLALVVLPWTVIGVWAVQDSLPGVQGSMNLPEAINQNSIYPDDRYFSSFLQVHYADYSWMHSTAMEGNSLLWNPDEGCGIPFFARWRSRVFSPFSLPFYFIESFATALRWSIYLKLLLAGLCAVYMARRFGIHLPMALFRGLSWQFSNLLLGGALLPLSDTFVWFPLILVLAEQFLHTNVRVWPLGAILFLLIALGGFVEGLLFSYLYLLLYIVTRSLRAKLWVHFFRAVLAAVLSILISIALCAIIIFPWLEYFFQLNPPYFFHGLFGKTDLIGIFFPGISASPWHAHPAFAGFASVLLLALWFSLRRFTAKTIRRRVEAMLLAGILMFPLLVIVCLTLPRYLLSIPTLLSVTLPGLLLALIYTAARSAEEWNALETESCKAALKRLPGIALLWWGLLIGISIKLCVTRALSI